MEEQELRNIVVATGPELLREGLVARTWGNISARVDDTHYLITPSGMDYEKLTADDLVLCDRVRGTFEGQNRPSSERGIHAIAYELFPEVGFVIHTHQVYATALGLAGFQRGSFTGDERVRLGGAAVAGYGLSGSKKLQAGVRAAMETGAHTVFMPHHGALICGRDHEEAMQRAKLLETLCRRCWRGTLTQEAVLPAAQQDSMLAKVRHAHPNARFVTTDALLTLAALQKPLRAQLEYMAQIIGVKMPSADPTARSISAALRHSPAVLVPGIGAAVSAEDPGDCEALGLLADKAAISALHVLALGAKADLCLSDAALQHWVYVHKYSKRKG